MENLELQKTANEVRKGIVTALHAAKAGHPGGSLSAADIYTYLYFEEMNIDPKDPKKAGRDRLVVSKGHTSPGYYSALANRGFFSGGRFKDVPSCRFLFTGTSGHEAHSGGGYVKRLSWTGDLRGSWNGHFRKAFRG